MVLNVSRNGTASIILREFFILRIVKIWYTNNAKKLYIFSKTTCKLCQKLKNFYSKLHSSEGLTADEFYKGNSYRHSYNNTHKFLQSLSKMWNGSYCVKEFYKYNSLLCQEVLQRQQLQTQLKQHTQIPTVLTQDVEWFLLCQEIEQLP